MATAADLRQTYVGPEFPVGPLFPKLPPAPPAPLPPVVQTTQLASAAQVEAATPPTARIYYSVQGDWWDLIAIRVYGAKRGNEHLMFRLLEENYYLRDVVQFSAGIQVVVPEVNVTTDIPLVPWKKATVLP
jgi:hypothetical protein